MTRMETSDLAQRLRENPDLAEANRAMLDKPQAVTPVTAPAASEHDTQVAVFAWADASGIEALEMLHATPNGGYRPEHIGAQLKAEGVKAGYPDISLDCARGRWYGLRIELKVGKNRPSAAQMLWIEKLRRYGYLAVVCYGFEDARNTILSYLALGGDL